MLNKEFYGQMCICALPLKFDGLVMVLTTQIQNLFLSFGNSFLLLLDEKLWTFHFLLCVGTLSINNAISVEDKDLARDKKVKSNKHGGLLCVW